MVEQHQPVSTFINVCTVYAVVCMYAMYVCYVCMCAHNYNIFTELSIHQVYGCGFSELFYHKTVHMYVCMNKTLVYVCMYV